jgi:hypothetical protein
VKATTREFTINIKPRYLGEADALDRFDAFLFGVAEAVAVQTSLSDLDEAMDFVLDTCSKLSSYGKGALPEDSEQAAGWLSKALHEDWAGQVMTRALNTFGVAGR